MKWHKLIARPLTEEEKEECPCAFSIWEGKLPEIEEKVLLFAEEEGIYIDKLVDLHTFVDFWETHLKDYDVVYWMSLPEPPKRRES